MNARRDELMCLVRSCASALSVEMRKVTKSDSVWEYRTVPGHGWYAPGLVEESELLGHTLSRLPDLLYGSSEFVDVDKVWSACVEALCTVPTSVRAVASEMLPSIPFPPLEPINIMVLVLGVIAMHRGKLIVKSGEVRLDLNGSRYGVFARTIMTREVHRRMGRNWGFMDPRNTLKTKFRLHPGPVDPRIQSLMGQTYNYLPTLGKTLSVLVGAILHSGPDFVEEFLKPFWFHDEDEDVRPQSIWDEARSLVMDSANNPTYNLKKMVMPLIGGDQFLKLFGNAGRAMPVKYTDNMRSKHMEALGIAEGSIPWVKKQAGRQVDPAAQELMKFKQLMGL